MDKKELILDQTKIIRTLLNEVRDQMQNPNNPIPWPDCKDVVRDLHAVSQALMRMVLSAVE